MSHQHYTVTIFLLSVYTILACWLIIRWNLFQKTGLKRTWLISLFLLKLAAAAFYGYVHTLSQYYPDKIDTWRWFFESLKETGSLKKDPAGFITSLFHNPYGGNNGDIFSTTNNYWNDLKDNIMIKMMALFNLLSGGRYYVNIIFYTVFSFAGLAVLYRFFASTFTRHKQLLIIICFLLPSVVFWGSGMHKEGIILSLLAFTVYAFRQLLNQKFRFRYLLTILFSMALLFMLRNYVLFALLPALACWWLAHRYPQRTAQVFVMGIALFMMAFFTARYLHPALDFPQTVSQRQQEFFQLSGTTLVKTDTLIPTVKGFIHNLPQAATMAWLRPLPGEGGKSYWPATMEVFLCGLLLVLFLFFRRSAGQAALLWFCGFFSITLLLLIGYSIPITGAVVRYRSVALPFFTALLALQVDWHRIFKRLK